MHDRVRIRVRMDGPDYRRTLMDGETEIAGVSYADTCDMLSSLSNALKSGKSGEYQLDHCGHKIEMTFFEAMSFVATTAGALCLSR